ncbi:hypothetical protein A5682_22045 [Mycobacterium mantenii]|uniref:Rv1733c family protein n=1 Tax=Mycobacterium mantenii TaxID=560555 RepID=UPI000801E28A|nr:hypothetical protein [Mycobacterium mantenii]OBH50944.1 hypothetical protein A5687_12680 [Mycobacterium mantenii]OBH77724.1 hypothetical protein A5682_22045 [Mycobacterium mantenii]
MEQFMLDPRCWRVARIFGRNPLLRRVDRIEAMVAMLAIVVSLVAIPIAGVAGTAVYGSRHSQYVQEANQRHAVVATITATGKDRVNAAAVQASWPVVGGDRSGPILVASGAKVGQHIRIWIDENGNPADPPTPVWQAFTVALATGLAIVLATALASAALATGIRARLDRARDVRWEREIRHFQENGGRTNQR